MKLSSVQTVVANQLRNLADQDLATMARNGMLRTVLLEHADVLANHADDDASA